MEISIGLVIATLISQFILPIHARTHLRKSQASTLEQLRDYYSETIMSQKNDLTSLDDHDLDENIVKSLLKQRALAKESRREPMITAFDTEHFMQSLYCEREILRAITFMHNAQLHLGQTRNTHLQSSAFKSFNDSVLLAINTLIKVIATNNPSQDHIHAPGFTGLKEDFQKNISTLSRDDLIYIDGFLFSAEILTNSLVKLAEIYQVPVYNLPAQQ